MYRVSIIIVNYNGKEFIGDCIEKLTKQTYRDFEIVIVDNCSGDDSLPFLKYYLNKIGLSGTARVIASDTNLGFAGGNLAGLRHAGGEYIALLNADAVAEPLWLQGLVEAMDVHNEAGICASRIMSYGSSVIDSAGDEFSKALQGFKRGEGEAPGSYNSREHVFGACACAALYRREMLDEVGFFDEDFFLIHEDTDLNLRAQLAGWKVLYVPEAVVYHKVRSSIGHMSDAAVYYTIRNRDLLRIKDVPAGVFLRCLPEFVIGIIAEFVYFVLKYRKLRLYMRAKRDAIRMLPDMKKKRSLIFKQRKVSNDYLMNVMAPLRKKGFINSKLKKMLHD